MRPRVAFALLLAAVVAAALGFWVAGPWLYRAAIGLDPSAFPGGVWLERVGALLLPGLALTRAGVLLSLLALLVAAAFAFFVVHRAAGAGPDRGRRRLLAAGLASLAAVAALAVAGIFDFLRAFRGLGNGGRGWAPIAREIFAHPVPRTAPEWRPEWKSARVRAYRRLGRTEWQVSDISLGSGRIRGELGEKLVREAIERGVNYIDTAPDYSASGSELAIGRAIRGRRDRLFLATKWCTPRGHLPAGSPVSRYIEVLEASLRRLGTDYVDLVHVHSCDEVDRLLDPNLHEAFDRLKQQGKARFLGFSSHTPRLMEVASVAIDSGHFDVMMLAYHHGIWPQLDRVIERARREQDMGVVAMKTLKGARQRKLPGFEQGALAYSQAAFRWVLANPDVSCLVVSFFEPQHLDEYLFASGSVPEQADAAWLAAYDRAILGSYCVPHCGACLGSCPHGLPIPDILRYRMYFEDYGWEDTARELYGRLEHDASRCSGCPAPCATQCPVGVAIPARMRGAHRRLRTA